MMANSINTHSCSGDSYMSAISGAGHKFRAAEERIQRHGLARFYSPWKNMEQIAETGWILENRRAIMKADNTARRKPNDEGDEHDNLLYH